MRFPTHLDSVIEQRFVEVIGYPNYIISSFGFVIRKAHEIVRETGFLHTLSETILTRYIDCLGYWTVDIKGNPTRLHRLLAEHFIPNPENKETVNHIDGNKWNLDLNNLEWATQSENNQHAYDSGLKIGAHTGKVGKDHHRSKPVFKCDLSGNVIKRYESVRQASLQEGKSTSYVHTRMKSRPKKSQTGIIWKYDN